MDGQVLRLHGRVVTFPQLRLPIKLWTYAHEAVFGIDVHKSEAWMLDLTTGEEGPISNTEQLVFARGDDFDAVELKNEIVFNYDDFSVYAQQVKELDRRKQLQVTIDFFRGRRNRSLQASRDQERFILMLAKGQADDKELWKGYTALGGSLEPKFRREKEGGYTFGEFSLDYLLDDLARREK